MTGAKMILHDWQRGKIPFFVPPPRQEDDDNLSEEPVVHGIDKDAVADSEEASAALKAIASVMASQQGRSVPVQKDLFGENELGADVADSSNDDGRKSELGAEDEDEDESGDDDENEGEGEGGDDDEDEGEGESESGDDDEDGSDGDSEES